MTMPTTQEFQAIIESKGKSVQRIVKYGSLTAVCIAVAPFVFMGIGGAVGLLVIGALGVVAINIAPVFARNMANRKVEWMQEEHNRHLRAIKAEAERNPVETMQSVYQENKEKVGFLRQTVVNFSGKVKNFESQLEKIRPKYPKDVAMFEQNLGLMKTKLSFQEAELIKANNSLMEYADTIEKADILWKLGLAAKDMNMAAGQLEDNFMSRLRSETAIDAITDQLNQSIASLEISVKEQEGTAAKMLAASSVQGHTFEMEKQSEKVGR